MINNMETYLLATRTLFSSCGKDEFPKDIDCLKTFLFDKCRSEQDCSRLLGLWIGLYKIMDMNNIKTEALAKAVEEKKLISFIQETYKLNYDSAFYFEWFTSNIDQFN
jgi:hypothetical protein